MAATTTQTAHASVSAFLNVRPQLERYVKLRLLPPNRETYRELLWASSLSTRFIGEYSFGEKRPRFWNPSLLRYVEKGFPKTTVDPAAKLFSSREGA